MQANLIERFRMERAGVSPCIAASLVRKALFGDNFAQCEPKFFNRVILVRNR